MLTIVEEIRTKVGWVSLYYDHNTLCKYRLYYTQDARLEFIEKFETRFFAYRRMNKLVKDLGGEVK